MDIVDELRKITQKIREMPNRDDKICCEGTTRMSILDGGGVGCFDVISLLEELVIKIKKGELIEETKKRL